MAGKEWDEGDDDDRAQAYIDAKRAKGKSVDGGSRELLLRKELEQKYGEVWNTAEMLGAYDVEGFGGGYAVVRRKSDGQRGSLDFTHSPRFYYSFVKG